MATVGFRVNGGKGFSVTFANGVTLSTQIGAGNYCDNYDGQIGGDIPRRMESHCAELAVWDANGKWITRRMMAELPAELTEDRGGDDVVGYASVELWLAVVAWCAAQERAEKAEKED